MTAPPMLQVDVTLNRAGTEHAYAFETDATLTGVFGASGAGKTTLLHLIAGLITPSAGTIRLGDEVLFDAASGINLPVHRRRVGVVFQDDRLFPHLTVRGNLLYGQRGNATAIGLDELARLLNLEMLIGRRTRNLSGGERRRVAIGRTLLMSPRLLLLDEPLTSLDRQHRAEIVRLLGRVRDEVGVPALHVSHELAELLQLTDRLLIIDAGRTVGHGPLREVVRGPRAWTALRELGAPNVLALTVRDHRAEAGLTELGAGELRLVAPPIKEAPGTPVAVAIRPGDIALATDRVSGISIRNQLPGRVVHVARHPNRAVAEIDVGASLLVELSLRAVEEMGLEKGCTVWALIKSNALEYV